MRFATTIRALGRSSFNRRSAVPSTMPIRGTQRFYIAHQSSNKARPAGALAASVIVASSLLLAQERKNRSRSAQCSALPSPPSSSTTENIAFAKPIEDINTVYKVGEVLGEGGFGQVFYATRIADDIPVALKCIPKEWTRNDEFQREIDVLQKLNVEDGGHPHICDMYDILEDEENYWLSMELITGGELFEHLIEEGAYSEARAAVFLRQFAEALSFIHKSGVVHGDLKPENLLLSSWDNEEAELKLVDFGCSIILDKCRPEDKPHSTLAYDPPEKLQNDLPPSYKSDVWAAGVILYIILTGTHPFDKSGTRTDEEMAELVKSIDSGEKLTRLIFDERTEDLSPSATNLLWSMLHPDPEIRATSEQIRRNRWVQGLTASWEILDGIDNKLERYWQKEFQSNIFKKFGGVVTDEQLHSVFKQIDEDGNGSIELEELTKVLEEARMKPRDIQSIFDAINLDHDKGISFEEFRSAMQDELPIQFYQSKFRSVIGKELEAEGGSMSESFRAASRRLFNSMDLDHNGSLDCHELRLLLRKLGVDEKEISLLVASVDLDKDGSLSFAEFSKVIFGARSKTV